MITGALSTVPSLTAGHARWLRHTCRGGRPPQGPWRQHEETEGLVILRPADDVHPQAWVDTAHLDPQDALHVAALGAALAEAASPVTHVSTIADFEYRAEWLREDRDQFLAHAPADPRLTDQGRAEAAGFGGMDPEVLTALIKAHRQATLPPPGHPLWPLRARIDALRRALAPTRPSGSGDQRYCDDHGDVPLTAGYVLLARTPAEAATLREVAMEEEQQADLMGLDPAPSAVYDLRDSTDRRALRLNVARRTHALQEVHRILHTLVGVA